MRLSRILMNHPHMAECAVESYRMWGEHVGSIMDCRERRAARGIARSGGFIRSRGSGSGTCRLAVAGGMDQRADCLGILRAGRQRAALALDFWSGRGGRAARPHGPRPRAGQGAGRLVGDRDAVGAGRVGAAELDLAAFGRRDREAHRGAHLDIAAQRGSEKGGFAWRRPRHTLKGRQDADAVDRIGLRLRLLKQQAKAGDITLLFGDESEALTHPYLARAWAKRGCDLRVEAPGQSKKRAMIGALDCAAHKLIVNTSATKRSGDFITFLGRLDAIYGPGPGRPDKPVIFVLDNGPIHISKASRAALAARDWLTIEWLPKYAPELNDIERSWRDLKGHFLAHQTFINIDHLDRAIHQGIAILPLLRAAGAKVRAFDPEGIDEARKLMPDIDYCGDAYQTMDGADALVLVTEWNEFRALDLDRVRSLLRHPVVIDLRNIYQPEAMIAAGLTYHSIGRPKGEPTTETPAGLRAIA